MPSLELQARVAKLGTLVIKLRGYKVALFGLYSRCGTMDYEGVFRFLSCSHQLFRFTKYIIFVAYIVFSHVFSNRLCTYFKNKLLYHNDIM